MPNFSDDQQTSDFVYHMAQKPSRQTEGDANLYLGGGVIWLKRIFNTVSAINTNHYILMCPHVSLCWTGKDNTEKNIAQ